MMKTLNETIQASYSQDYGVEALTVNEILIPFYNQFGMTRVACTDKATQYRDIDCMVDGKPIQEKSGTTYSKSNPKLTVEVYNNILATGKDDGKYGWGLITEAYRHIYGYRGTSDKESINPSEVYVGIYESSVIKKICWEAVNTPEFEEIVNSYTEKLKEGLSGTKPVRLGNCKLKTVGEVEVWSNASKKSKGTGTKYAVTINIPMSNFKGEKKIYKLINNKFSEL